MRYFKWKLSEGTWGTGPEVELNSGNKITAGSYVDSDGILTNEEPVDPSVE